MKLAKDKYIFLLAIVVKFRRAKWRVGKKIKNFCFYVRGIQVLAKY